MRPAKLIQRYGLQLNLYRLALQRHRGPATKIRAVLLAIGRDSVRQVEVPPEPDCEKLAVDAAVSMNRVFMSTDPGAST